MDVNNISTLIASIGIPGALCFVMAYIIYKMNEQHKEEMNSLNAQYKEGMDKMQTALNNNTLAIQHLTDMITKTQ